MDKLLSGYFRFREEVYPGENHRFRALANSQKPHTLFITCSDSRVDPSMILQAPPGELFVCRVVGNLVPAHGGRSGGVTCAVEYAVAVLDVEHIVVCGHSDCGAMRAFLHPERLRGLNAVASWLDHASAAIAVTRENHSHLGGDQFLEALAKENVISQLQHLRTHPVVASRLRKGTLQIHGWYFNIGDGLISMYEEGNEVFQPLVAA